MSKAKNLKKKKQGLKKKVLSLSFLISIPLAALLTAFNIYNIVIYHFKFTADPLAWSTFGLGFIASISILEGVKLSWFRTFIHELKHAIVILCTGNRIKNFHVEKHTGHVEFYIQKDKLHFKPLIMVSPYFLPLFSAPVFIACLIFDASFSVPLWLILGATLAADLDMGFREIHPHQTDISNMFGGIILVGLFIVSMKLMWCSFCLLWVTGGWESLQTTGATAWGFLSAIAEGVASILEARKNS